MKKSLDRSIKHNDALVRLISEYKGEKLTREYYKKVVFLGVKTIAFLPIDRNSTYKETRELFNSICFIKNYMSRLTHQEFENIFPIQKIYDGERWECKDYFYTKKYLKTLNPNEPIGDNLDELMWEYVNTEIRLFNAACFMVVDHLLKFEGKKSMMEEWADMNGITTYLLRKDGNKEYLYDKKSGKTIRIKKSKPRYLKLLK